MFESLIEHIKQQHDSEEKELFLAVLKGDLPKVKEILKTTYLAVWALTNGHSLRNPEGIWCHFTVIPFALEAPIEKNKKEILEYLRLKDEELLDEQLVAQAMYDNAEAVRTLLEKGANPNMPGKSSPLHKAAFSGSLESIEVARLLLEAKAEVGAVDQHGDTPLKIAAEYGTLEVVKLLLEADEKASPALLKANHIDYRSPDLGYTALYIAAHKGRYEIVKELLAAGADLSIADQCGYTPLHACVSWCQNDKVVKLLLEAGANPNAKTHHGRTPLSLVPLGMVDKVRLNNIIKYLIAHKAEIDLTWDPERKDVIQNNIEKVAYTVATSSDDIKEDFISAICIHRYMQRKIQKKRPISEESITKIQAQK